MSDDQPEAPAQETLGLNANLTELLVKNYCVLATSALLWFDYVLTFPSEYRRIWRRKFTGATLIFLLMRYAALIERVPFVLEILVWKSSNRCGVIMHMDDVLTVISYLAIAAFTALRAYSIWGRDWKPLVIVVPVSFYSSLALVYESVRYIPGQGGAFVGCFELSYLSAIALHRFYTTSQAAPIAAASLVILLTWVKTFSIVRYSWKAGFSTPLATFLLRDGTVYFLALVTCRLLPLIVNYLYITSLPSTIVILVWQFFGQALIVIIHSRFILDLRGLYFANSVGEEESEPPSRWSGINFRGASSVIVGNLGATLDLVPGPSLGPQDIPTQRQNAMDCEYEMEWEDEAPKYCDDPFTTGMRSSETSDVVQEPTQDVGDDTDGRSR